MSSARSERETKRRTAAQGRGAGTGLRALALGCVGLGLAALPASGPAQAHDPYEWRGAETYEWSGAAPGGWQLDFGWADLEGRALLPGEWLFEYGARSPGLWGEPALPDDIDRFAPLLELGEVIVLRGETVWRPYASLDWRPFTDGAWNYEAGQGWVWSGADPWSHITDHTGTWRDDVDMGWVWSPRGAAGWSPARVAWRIGAGLVGWAPIGPDGAADPRHFVFIPLEGLIAPGQTAALGPAESRAVYGRTRALSTDEALRLSPADLAAYGGGRAPRDAVAALPAPAYDAPIRTAPLEPIAPAAPSRFDTEAPEGRFEAGPGVSTLPEPGARPEAPILRTPPPVPTQRPSDLAALPQPAVSEPSSPGPTAAAPRVSGEAAPDAAPESASEPETATGPRVVGPRWLSNGDCSARGIREGRCRTD